MAQEYATLCRNSLLGVWICPRSVLSCARIWEQYSYGVWIHYYVYEYGPSLYYRAQSTLSCLVNWPQYTYSRSVYVNQECYRAQSTPLCAGNWQKYPVVCMNALSVYDCGQSLHYWCNLYQNMFIGIWPQYTYTGSAYKCTVEYGPSLRWHRNLATVY